MREEYISRVLNALKNFAFQVICYSTKSIFLSLYIVSLVWPIIAVLETENPYWFFGYFISFFIGLGIEFLESKVIFGIEEEDEDFDLI